ncbi:MAG: GNAT family N-acetyltransferase [Treponema sp.]|nr:GNAT family N-acetyltransferase [Treponema sp.]
MSASKWRKVSGEGYPAAESYLRHFERFCVSASARFIKKRDHVWYLAGPGGDVSSLLIHSRYSLYPVFGDNTLIPCPSFLKRFLIKVPVHSVQGIGRDVERLEALMEDQGYFASERIHYNLMSLDTAPARQALGAGPPSLVLRPPNPADKEELFALHSAYEKEEVLPPDASFNPASSLHNLERILGSERMLLAELEGKIVGKLNTNAVSFTRFQIGGVYVRPEYRGLGIATRMIAAFSSELLASGFGITLFSKSHNKAAKKAYLKAGFSVLTDYRISYF